MNERLFNPFDAIPILGGLANVRTRRLLAVVPVMVALLVSVAFLDGTLGEIGDFTPVRDARLVLGAEDIGSPPAFPLLRDIPSMWLFAAIVLTFLIVHRQWRLMAVCVRDLERNGVVAPLDEAEPYWLLSLGHRLYPGDGSDRDPLDMVMRQAREYVGSVGLKLTWVFAICAVIGTAWVMLGEYHSLFEVVAPDSLSGAQREAWLDRCYDEWWASFNHPPGAVVYLALSAFALFVIIMQNIVGLACSYFVFTLPKVARIDVDWLNRDGLYGWRPIAMIFRTVYWSLTLHGATLAVILIALGPTHMEWIAWLLVIWLIVAPIYIGGSIRTFRRVEQLARDRRRTKIETEMQSARVTTSSPSEALMPFMFDLDRTAKARIRPLRLGRWSWSFMAASYLFPAAVLMAELVAAT